MSVQLELHDASADLFLEHKVKWHKSCHLKFAPSKLMIDWLIDYLLFYVPLKSFSLLWKRHHCRWRAAKFRSMLGAQGLWAGRDLYRATPTATRGLGFSGLIRRAAPFSRLLRHAWGRGGPILTRILTGVKVDESYLAKTAAITLCGMNLLCKDLPLYCSIGKLSTKVPPSRMHRDTPTLEPTTKNVSYDQLTLFQLLRLSKMNSYLHAFLLAQRKYYCYDEIWKKKKCVETLDIHRRTNDVVQVFGNTEKLSKRQLCPEDKGCFA
jgi:hypothetical protein